MYGYLFMLSMLGLSKSLWTVVRIVSIFLSVMLINSPCRVLLLAILLLLVLGVVRIVWWSWVRILVHPELCRRLCFIRWCIFCRTFAFGVRQLYYLLWFILIRWLLFCGRSLWLLLRYWWLCFLFFTCATKRGWLWSCLLPYSTFLLLNAGRVGSTRSMLTAWSRWTKIFRICTHNLVLFIFRWFANM